MSERGSFFWPAMSALGAVAFVAALTSTVMHNGVSETPRDASAHFSEADDGDTYCVIGVRPDGTRVKLQGGLREDKANDLRRRLSGVAALPEVQVERESRDESRGQL